MLSYKVLLCVLGLGGVTFLSCNPPKALQHAVYFSDSITEAEKTTKYNIAFIKPGDRLSINITAIDKTAAEEFNTSAGSQGSAQSGSTGYLVDSSGNIQLLQLGILHVAGFSTFQIRDTLQQILVNFIKGPIVTVSIINFQINMMGEVGHPGTLNVLDGRMNILQAITQAGDITQYGLRNNILVIRETNGKREFGRVDISSNKIFESPYYYLRQNDVVYVEPSKAKFNDVTINRNLRDISIATTVLSTFVLIISLATRK